ncbi:RNA recognition motif domain-containing protein [Ditylenchus destructor]|uniref:RNA recognition motif domain-containing protein n=1 Tax=Ditylenchus destructor TaxID=166010 RepID=A0AAD4MTV8_9BILA|nr:RNA recognition motif domain-containing protein [Ditylenchus destructor]
MECCVCNEQGYSTSFHTNSSLQEHIAGAHCKADLYACDSCHLSFVSEYVLLKHLQNSCDGGNRNAMLDTQIAGKLELYDFMEKSINASLSKKTEKAEVNLSTQANNPGLNNEKSNDTVSINICPRTENSDVQEQSSPMELELIRQAESLSQIEPQNHVENVVSDDPNKDTISFAESVLEEEKPADSSKTLENENGDDDVVQARRKAARAQATSTEAQSTGAKVPDKAGHRIFVSGINAEGVTEDKISEILNEYFAIFGEVNGIKILKDRFKKLSGTAHVKFKNLADQRKALVRKTDVKIGNSVCQLRKLSDKKVGMWHFSRNQKRLLMNGPVKAPKPPQGLMNRPVKAPKPPQGLMNRPVKAPKPPQRSKQNRSFGQNRSFNQLRDHMNSGIRPHFSSPMQAESAPYSQSWRSDRDAPMYTPGMPTPALMEYHNLYMESHVRDQQFPPYLQENRIRETRMSEFHDRMGSYDQQFPYHSPVFPPSVNYTDRPMVHSENRNYQAMFPPYTNYGNSPMMFQGHQNLPGGNMDFNHYQTPGTSNRYYM